MLIDDKGLKLSAFNAVLKDVFGNRRGEEGFKLLAEATAHQHERVELRDWLYVLAKSPGTEARKTLIDEPSKKPEEFIELIEQSFEHASDTVVLPPAEICLSTVTPDVTKMLERAETLLRDNRHTVIFDELLTLALFEVADPFLRELVEVYLTADGLKRFEAKLRGKVLVGDGDLPALFDEKNNLNPQAFSASGRNFCKRLREDMAAMGATRITTRHLLYTILSSETAPLPVALSASGLNVKKDLHAVLSRELVRPGKKRNGSFQLSKESLFQSVVSVLMEAQKGLSGERKAKEISEIDIHKAFLAKEERELTRLFTKDMAVNLTTVRDYLSGTQEDEVEPPPLQRFTIQEIQDKINGTIFGQQVAVKRIEPWIKRLRFGIPRDGRPAGVFLFLGPTGTGKTQLAKELARYVYGDEDQLLFLEMGQFNSKESMNIFIGAPPGYVGYGEGKLTNGLRDKPECVVLFDEIEKAHIQVFDALLRFADEGIISDPAGPVRDGRKCIIVMTTNAGQQWLRDHVKDNAEARNNPESLVAQLFDAATKELAKNGFRPEFLGRVDEKITFLPFSVPTCRQIVDNILRKELAKFAELKRVTIEVPDKVRDILAQSAFDRAMEEGARGAPRAVNEHIVSPAIDILSDCEERGEMLPPGLIASVLGIDKISLEKA